MQVAGQGFGWVSPSGAVLDPDGSGLWGFIDAAGAFVVPPRFRDVTPYLGGYARGIEPDGTYVWIDIDGDPILSR